MGVHLPKGLLPQDQFEAAVEWEEELLCPEEETAMGVPLGENPSLPAEMCICHQGMMATRRKTATPAEITRVPGIPGTTRHRHGTTPTGTMGTQVPVTTILPEAIAIEMGTVETETIQTIRVAAPIEIHMRVMVEDFGH